MLQYLHLTVHSKRCDRLWSRGEDSGHCWRADPVSRRSRSTPSSPSKHLKGLEQGKQGTMRLSSRAKTSITEGIERTMRLCCTSSLQVFRRPAPRELSIRGAGACALPSDHSPGTRQPCSHLRGSEGARRVRHTAPCQGRRKGGQRILAAVSRLEQRRVESHRITSLESVFLCVAVSLITGFRGKRAAGS